MISVTAPRRFRQSYQAIRMDGVMTLAKSDCGGVGQGMKCAKDFFEEDRAFKPPVTEELCIKRKRQNSGRGAATSAL
ncbi:MAG TPA: hypothetical protein DCZ59_11060 [Bacteroidetes bacterium]|nr:hypothetical protein [Bacteroidota bacterium]